VVTRGNFCRLGLKMAMGMNYPQTRGYQTRRARIRAPS